MFSFFKKKTGDIPPEQDNSESSLADSSLTPHESSEVSPGNIDASSGIAKQDTEKKQSWLSRLKSGLAKTSANLNIFGGTTIDEELFEELETALLVSDVGMPATEYLLDELRRKVKEEKLTQPSEIKTALAALLTDLLASLAKKPRNLAAITLMLS